MTQTGKAMVPHVHHPGAVRASSPDARPLPGRPCCRGGGGNGPLKKKLLNLQMKGAAVYQ